jgi:hypothetical protein
MRGGGRIAVLLAVLLAVVLVKVGHETYRWWAYAEEREQLRALTTRLEEAGFDVVSTQLAADSLRRGMLRTDSVLDLTRQRVGEYERRAEGGTLPPHLFEGYRTELATFNRRVAERNETLYRWEEVVTRNHVAVGRYNAIADSMRLLATGIGEPYFPVPSPLEAAARRGLAPAMEAERP